MDQQIGKILKTDSTSAERLEGYHQIIKILQEEKEIPTSLLTSVSAIFHQLKEDIACDHVKISQDALYFLGVLLSQPMIISSVHSERVGDIIKDICHIIKTTSEKAVCTRALWCLMKQRMPMDIYLNKLTDILHSLEYASQMFSKTSISVEIEAIRVLNRLVTELPEALGIRSGMWARRLYLATLHSNHKVREVALATLIAARPCLETQQCELLSRLISDLKETIVPEMLKLFKEKQELHVLKLWNVLLDILGKTLHQGATLINNLLTVVEKAFKSPIAEVKIAAFKCWQHLMDNFGTELDVLANPKRLRLVMQPLKANNARAESIAHVKFEVWWHLCICLGPKLTTNMDMVANPLLQICFGLSETSSQLNSTNGVSTPKLNLSTASVASSPGGMHTFPSVHRLGCECLAQILSHGQTLSITQPTFTIGTLTHPVLTSSSIFLHHATLLLSALKEGIARLTCDKKDLHLQLFLWHSVIAHIRTISETENIKEISDVLTTFFTILEDFVRSNDPSAEVVLKLVEITASLPQRILTSSALSISSASVMNGTPSLFLITLLFNPYILKSCSSQERFITSFQKLISTGINVNTSALNFIHSVVKLLDAATAHIELSELLYQLWGIIVFPLLEYIQKNQEVNQGDALEHDFSCLYAILIYPVQHLFKRPLLQNNFTTLVRTWSALYKTFASSAALVANTEGNICCEEFCFSVSSTLSSSDLEDILLLDYFTQLLLIVVTAVNFSPASLQDPLTATAHILTASPSARMKRKQKPLGNLTSLTRLTKDVLNAIVKSSSSSESSSGSASSDKILHLKVIGTVIDIIQHLYSHLTVSKLIGAVTTTLSSSMSKLFLEPLKNDMSKTQHGQLLTKLESMWNAVVNCVQMNFNGIYDSDFLTAVSPLLEETLLCPRKNIRLKSRSFWLSGFSESYESLNVPESLLIVLKKVKPAILPGSIDNDETADGILASFGDESEGPSQDSEMVSSPHKMNVPVHNKVEEIQFKVPASDAKMETSSSNKRPRVDEADDKEFTKIIPEVKRRRLLTDHQKEILSTRSDIPAMYNDLSQSQDIICITSQLLDEVESQEAISNQVEQNNGAEKAVIASEMTSPPVEPQVGDAKEPERDVIVINSQESVSETIGGVGDVNEQEVILVDGSLPEDSSKLLKSDDVESESGFPSENLPFVAMHESQSLLEAAPASLIATVGDETASSVECHSPAGESEMQDATANFAVNAETASELPNDAESVACVNSEEESSSAGGKPTELSSSVALEEEEVVNETIGDEAVSDVQKVSDNSTMEIEPTITDKVLNQNGPDSLVDKAQAEKCQLADSTEENLSPDVAAAATPLSAASLVKYISTNKTNTVTTSTSNSIHNSIPKDEETDDIIPSSQMDVVETTEHEEVEEEEVVSKPIDASSIVTINAELDSHVPVAKSEVEVSGNDDAQSEENDKANNECEENNEQPPPPLPRRRGRPPKWETEKRKKEKEATPVTEDRVLRSRFKEQGEHEKESPASTKKVQLSSAEMYVTTTSTAGDGDAEEIQLVVADTVEIAEKFAEEASEQEVVEMQTCELEEAPSVAGVERDAIIIEVAASENVVEDSKLVANNVNSHDADQESDSSIEPEPCITYSAPVDKGEEESGADDVIQVCSFADVYPLESAAIPLASDEVTVGQDEPMEQVLETDASTASVLITEEQLEQAIETSVVPTEGVIITDDQLANDDKEQVIYVVSDDLDDGAVSVLVNSGIEIDLAKEAAEMEDLSQGIKIDPVTDSPTEDAAEEVVERYEVKWIDGKSDDKGTVSKKPLKRKMYNPYRPEDELLTFIPQGNTKTYSRDNAMKHYVVRAEGDGMLGITHRSPLINRMNRGGRLLDAATKKNLDAYEKMKYEQRRSFDKIEETDEAEQRKSEHGDSGSSTDNSVATDVGNVYPELSVQLRTASEVSPSSSPSSGILKKKKLEFASASSTGSPTYRQRRVSFADPLVQDEVEYSDWNKDQPKVAVNQCLELNTADSVTYTLSSPLNNEQQLTQVQCVPQTVELAHISEVSQSAELASTTDVDNVVEVSEVRIVDGADDGSAENSEVITVQLYSNIAESEVSEVTTGEGLPGPAEAEIHQYQEMEISFEVDETKKDFPGSIVFAEIPCSTGDVSIDMNQAVVLASSDMSCVEADEKSEVIKKDDIYIDSQALLELPPVEEMSTEQYESKEVVSEPSLVEVTRITAAEDGNANVAPELPAEASADQPDVASVASELEPVGVGVPEDVISSAVEPTLVEAATAEVASVPSSTVPVASCSVSEDSGEPPSKVLIMDSKAVLELSKNLRSCVTAETIRRMPVTDIVFLQKQLCDMAATVASSLLSLSNPHAASAPNQE